MNATRRAELRKWIGDGRELGHSCRYLNDLELLAILDADERVEKLEPIDPKDVKEGECLECGRPENAHLTLEYHGSIKPQRVAFCLGAKQFTPKPPAPKAKPGVRYRSTMGAVAIGTVSGCLLVLTNNCYLHQETPLTPDWQEVE